MGSGQIHKEIFAKKIKEQIDFLNEIEEKEGFDIVWIQQILRESIKYYYKDDK